jgi:K+-sensing histidine kinase KdpD
MPGPRPLSPMRSALQRYGLAIVFVGAALALTDIAQPLLSPHFWYAFLFAVVGSAWFGGKGPGWTAVISSIAGIDYFFAAPLHSFRASRDQIPILIGFSLCAIIANWIATSRRRADAARELEFAELAARVGARTLAHRDGQEPFVTGIREHRVPTPRPVRRPPSH